ncbi:MAG: hypothetical protein HXK70_01805, partial [Clostridiales bacterium]|nr:hypothetical protein [Clostridiales bacterium]
LFRYNILARDFSYAFQAVAITNIPENLFKYNIEAERFDHIFTYCIKLIQIPENLFRYNTKINDFHSSFSYCSKINNIPNNIITKAKTVKENGGNVDKMFFGCSNATNYYTLPEYIR